MSRTQDVPKGHRAVVNHKKAEVHFHPTDDSGKKTSGMDKLFTFYPGMNFVKDEDLERLQKIPVFRSFEEDEVIEIDGEVSKDEVPTLKEFVEAGYNPKDYLLRYPKNQKKVDPADIAEAQRVFDEDVAQFQKDKRAGRV